MTWWLCIIHCVTTGQWFISGPPCLFIFALWSRLNGGIPNCRHYLFGTVQSFQLIDCLAVDIVSVLISLKTVFLSRSDLLHREVFPAWWHFIQFTVSLVSCLGNWIQLNQVFIQKSIPIQRPLSVRISNMIFFYSNFIVFVLVYIWSVNLHQLSLYWPINCFLRTLLRAGDNPSPSSVLSTTVLSVINGFSKR